MDNWAANEIIFASISFFNSLFPLVLLLKEEIRDIFLQKNLNGNMNPPV